MKIFHKFSLAILSISFLLGGVGIISFWQNQKIKNTMNQGIIKAIDTREIIENIQDNLRKIESKTYSNFWENPGDVRLKERAIKKSFASLRQEIIELNEAVENLIKFDSNSPIEEKIEEEEGGELHEELNLLIVVNDLNKQLEQLESIVTSILNNDIKSEKKALLLQELQQILNNEIYPLLKKTRAGFSEDQREKKAVIQAYLNRNDLIIAGTTGASLILSIMIGLYAARTISRPILQLKTAALLAGQGEFDLLLPDITNDEIGILTREFNAMLSGLKQTTVSKSYLDNILSSISESLIVIEIDGTIKKVNRATCALLGYQEQELLGKSIQSLVADSSFTLESLTTAKLLNNFDLTYITKQGKKIPVAFSHSLIKNHCAQIEGIACLARDMSEKKRAEQLLKQSEERYALAAQAVNDGLWDWNLVSNQIYFSPRWKYLLGYEETALDDKLEEWFGRIHLDHQSQVLETIFAYLQNPLSHLEITYPILHNNGNYRWMLCRGIAVKNQSGKITRLIGSQTDITQSHLDREKLRQLALYDSLTNLPNRSFLMEQLQNLFEISKQNPDKQFVILLLDIDAFKKINDSLGHLVGDELLTQFSARVQQCLPNQAILARLGGDEFAILAENMIDLQDGIDLAQTILAQLKKPFQLQEQELFATVSIGIALYHNQYLHIEDLLRDADTAMYRAKAKGKARYQVFQPTMHFQVKQSLEVENSLRRAIAAEDFQVFYQPIVKLTNREIVGFEALLRWQHPSLGMISPNTFIPIAEETGLIVPLGKWILEQACHQMSQWQAKYRVARAMSISVNLSPIQLQEYSLSNSSACLDQLQQIFRSSGLAPESLKLEITETSLIDSFANASQLLHRIKDLGIQLSMDDFGTGYSSLNSLHHLPVDVLKIDRSFIEELTTNHDKLELIKTILNLAGNLKMEVIAEGIETPAQRTQLQQLNCQYGQGYLFSQPIDSQDAEVLISTMELLPQYLSMEFDIND
ncbi:MAG: EAL domain-containing protein [Prochloraceae cyanobacterium]|nr:EAL domain-containing protein [Prochloraceae cyanobacterium]